MAYDPRHEDYQRLGLRFARTLDRVDAYGTARAFASFSRRYAQNRDSLPQSDADRAFHLVAEAADIVDYQLPFADELQTSPMVSKASKLLSEAIEIDGACFDAHRMIAAASFTGFEGYYRYLKKAAPEVKRVCEARKAELTENPKRDDAPLAADLALRPYLRWQATLASKALVCGRYRLAIEHAQELLASDPLDIADVRFTCAIAYAKLEDEHGLDELYKRFNTRDLHREDDPWRLLSRLALAYKRNDRDQQDQLLRNILTSFPHAASTLERQDELPDGIFSRLAVAPYSEDELILAVSEATVLLQEGVGYDRGSFGNWLASHALLHEAT